MAIAACLLLALLDVPASACPTCKQAIAENDPAHTAMVSGYFYSILFMMSMPFLILGSFGGMAFLAIRRNEQKTKREASTEARPMGS